MSEDDAPLPAGTPGRDHRAEIVERLYDVALDPIRLEDLLEVWEGRRTPLPPGQGNPLNDPEIEAHVRRATVFLDRFEASRGAAGRRSVLQDIPRSAAFLADGAGEIVDCNRPAEQAFGLSPGCTFDRLPFDPQDRAVLRAEIRRVAEGRVARVVTLRIRSERTGGPVILRISRVEAAGPLALAVSTELVWPEGFEQTVQEAFGLTGAEVEIVRGIALGLPVKEIAETRGRSPETVRTQLRSILAKTETHSQSELVRVVLGLMNLAQVPAEAGREPAPRRQGSLEPRRTQEIQGPDGRRLTWIEFGDPQGRPVLYMHMDYGLVRWPATAERAAQVRGLRVVVPVRAGYGRTELHPREVDHLQGVTRDYAAVLDHLGLAQAVVLPLGSDLRFAMNLANTRPELVRGIVGCACQLPLSHASQYERMDKWQRFILANARYAPRVLPFLVQAGFSLARRLGKAAFFAQVNGGSPADMQTFARAEVREAVLTGSDVCLTRNWSAHEAFARECISSERDWSAIVRACPVPVRLFQGDQDPQTPLLTIQEQMAQFPHLDIRILPQTGQLLFFSEWPQVLDAVEAMVGISAPLP